MIIFYIQGSNSHRFLMRFATIWPRKKGVLRQSNSYSSVLTTDGSFTQDFIFEI